MSCTKSLTLTAGANDYPLDDAVYVPTDDIVVGTMGPYLVKCNASTGALLTTARITAPLLGPCRIVYHADTDLCYVSTFNSPANQFLTTTQPTRDIFPVTPDTLELGAGLGIYSLFGNITEPFSDTGPHAMVSYDNYLFFVWASGNDDQFITRIDPSNTADYVTIGVSNPMDEYEIEQFDITDVIVTDRVYYANAQNYRMRYNNAYNFATNDYSRWAVPYRGLVIPNATEFCLTDNKPYAVGSNKYLIKINDYFTEDYTVIDLSVTAGYNPRPVRVRYSGSDGLLYLPDPSADSVLIFDTASETVTDVLMGFDNPFDVVFTGTTIFAVQHSSTGLKEIV